MKITFWNEFLFDSSSYTFSEEESIRKHYSASSIMFQKSEDKHEKEIGCLLSLEGAREVVADSWCYLSSERRIGNHHIYHISILIILDRSREAIIMSQVDRTLYSVKYQIGSS